MPFTEISEVSTASSPEFEPDARSDRERRRLRITSLSNLVIIAVGIFYLVQYWRLGATTIAWGLAVGVTLAVLNLAILLRTKRFKLCGYIATTILFGVVLQAIWFGGGFYDPIFPWLFLVPLAAAFLVDLTALWIFVVLGVNATVFLWLFPEGAGLSLVSTEMQATHSLLNRLVVMAALGVMTSLFARAQHLARRLLADSNRALELEAAAHEETAEKMRKSEAGYRDLIEHSADLIWTHDLDGMILGVNEAFRSFLGYTADQLVGLEVQSLLGPDSHLEWGTYLETIREEGAFRGLMTLVDSHGEPRVLEFHNTLREEGAQPLVRGLARDVSKQVAAQQALEIRIEQEQLMVAISTRFIHLDPAQVFTAIEGALAEVGDFLHCDRMSFLVRSPGGEEFECPAAWQNSDVVLGPTGASSPTQLPWVFSQLERFETIVASRLREAEYAGKKELASLFGGKTGSAMLVPVSGRQGLLGVLTAEDATEGREWRRKHQALVHLAGNIFGSTLMRARDEQETLRLESEVQQARKMESMGLIAGGIAHDFNNLLMVILGNTSVALSQVQEGSGAEEALRAIESSAKRAGKLTSQMLAYSGRAAVDRKPTDLGGSVDQELARMRADWPAQVELTTTFDDEMPLVFADASLVRQLLRNLVDNSLEAFGDQPGAIEVKTDTVVVESFSGGSAFRPIRRKAPPGTYGRLTVRDTGPGIDRAVLPKVFDPFFSTKFTGRGLGLAAAMGIVRGHEGAIELVSDRDGTRMEIYLPVAAVQGEPELVAPAASAKQVVLLIDREPAVLAVLERLLASGGFDSLRAEGSKRALELLGDSPAELSVVIADLDVAEASPELKELRWRNERLPWILSSVEDHHSVADRLVAHGASGFLPKPFDGEKLLSLVRSVLREYEFSGPVEVSQG